MKHQFHIPEKETRNRKTITILCMFGIMISLYAVAYFLFLRTVEVDVTKDASIIYRGETQSASVSVENTMKAYNQRVQEFMDSITYEVTPITNIANGDTIIILATYDKELAHSYNIKPINETRSVKVNDLPVRFESNEEIPDAYLKTITKRGNAYLESHMDAILQEDFTSFYVDSKQSLVKKTFSYRLFLNSKFGEYKDKIIDVYAISAKGDVNVSSEGEVLEEREETIYYMITYNEINTSLKISDENVYGEKLIVNGEHDFQNVEDFMNYMTVKYADHYEVNQMEISKK